MTGKMSLVEKITGKAAVLYDHLLSIADPVTGRVAITGREAGKIIGATSQSGRTYLEGLCREGKLVRISEVKSGVPTLFRIPSMCLGDTLTYYEDTVKKTEAPKRPALALQIALPPEPAPIAYGFKTELYRGEISGTEACDRFRAIANTFSKSYNYSVKLEICEVGEIGNERVRVPETRN